MQKHESLWFAGVIYMSTSNNALESVMHRVVLTMHVMVVCKPVYVCKCMCVFVCKCWCESVCGMCNWIPLLYLNTRPIYVILCFCILKHYCNSYMWSMYGVDV